MNMPRAIYTKDHNAIAERMNHPGAELRGISDTYRSANKLGCERCIC